MREREEEREREGERRRGREKERKREGERDSPRGEMGEAGTHRPKSDKCRRRV